jgi:hypothetical protein
VNLNKRTPITPRQPSSIETSVTAGVIVVVLTAAAGALVALVLALLPDFHADASSLAQGAEIGGGLGLVIVIPLVIGDVRKARQR